MKYNVYSHRFLYSFGRIPGLYSPTILRYLEGILSVGLRRHLYKVSPIDHLNHLVCGGMLLKTCHSVDTLNHLFWGICLGSSIHPFISFPQKKIPGKIGYTLKVEQLAPEKWWLEDDPFLLEWSIFSGYVELRGGYQMCPPQ